GAPCSRLAQLGPGRPLPNLDRPDKLFGLLFSDGDLAPAELARRWQRRKSVLDELQDDYRALLTELGREDRRRLENHLESLRAVESRVALVSACKPGEPEGSHAELSGDGLPQAARAVIDTLALGFACDLTRMATIVLRPPGGGASYFPWLGQPREYA